MHLIIDGYGRNPALLDSEEFVYRFLDEYPAAINMTKISLPQVVRYAEGPSQDWGLSGFVFIAESHIAIHTFVARCYVNIDIFSCKEFDADRIISGLTGRLQLTEVRSRLFDRSESGLSHPGKRDEIAFTRQ